MELKKDIKYYLDHPDEMPTDPAEIEKLSRETIEDARSLASEVLTVDRYVETDDKKEEAAPSSGDKATEKKEEAEPAQKEEAKTEGESKDKPEGEADPKGILAKDGEHIIPYSQLTAARERAAAAEALATQQAERIRELEAQAKGKPEGTTTEKQDDSVQMLTDDELNTLSAEQPTLAAVLRAQQAALRAVQTQLQSVVGESKRRAQDENAAMADEVQSAIDAVPELAGWQADKDRTMWEAAKRIDLTIRDLPKYKDMSFKDRFEAVVRLTHEAMDEKRPEPPKKEKPTQEEIRAAAEAKLEDAKKRATPKSLSDIPGGAPPEKDERERVENMSAVELGNKFMGMTQEQINAFITTL